MTALAGDVDERGRGGIVALVDVLRDIARGGLAGALAGVVAGGIGGRIVMRLAAVLDPTSSGRATENGNRIGDITLEGTFSLVIFGGLFAGLFAAVVWVGVRPWIPGTGLRRAAITAPIAVALSGFFLVESDNVDFLILEPDVPVVAMLLGVIALLGVSIALADDWLDRRLPRAGGDPLRVLVPYGAIALAGATILPPAVGQYVSREFCFCAHPPVPVGLAIAVAGGATVGWWILRARGHRSPPIALLAVGRGALGAAVVLGSVILFGEVSAVLATP